MTAMTTMGEMARALVAASRDPDDPVSLMNQMLAELSEQFDDAIDPLAPLAQTSDLIIELAVLAGVALDMAANADGRDPAEFRADFFAGIAGTEPNVTLKDLSQSVATVVEALRPDAGGVPNSVLRERIQDHPAAAEFTPQTCDLVVAAIRQSLGRHAS